MFAKFTFALFTSSLLIASILAQPPQFDGRGFENLFPLIPEITASSSPSPTPLPFASPGPNILNVSPSPAPRGTSEPMPPAASCRRLACRDLTGQCTSTTNPMWGQARFAQFSYDEGSSSAVPTGQNLKSAREISNIVCAQSSNTVNKHGLNELFTFFGQFLDHNFAATPESKDEHFDIDVPASDPNLSIKKLPFRRSTRGLTGVGQNVRPINTLPSAVDLVAVYGPDKERNRELLELDSGGKLTGKLKTSGGDLLPLNQRGLVNSPDTSSRYFVAGDHRANEHPVLTSIHTIFLREHNRLVDLIQERDRSLSGERLYEYARKLNVAQFQKIVYEEFYPAIIRTPLPPYRGFKRSANPTISDIFAGAAFRVGHTLVGQEIPRRGFSGPLSPIKMPNTFFRLASEYSSDELDNLFRGVANSPAQEVDSKVVNLLRNFLFTNVPGEEGFDLVARNIQRGRDHALPKFNEIRSLFKLRRATSFSRISKDSETADRLARAYDGNVDDVEAFVGLISESHKRGSGMGATMEAVWKAEFTRLRDGDQFFYLNMKKFPPAVRSKLVFELARLRARSLSTFRELIVRNSGVSGDQLPRGNIFNLKQ